MNGVTELLFFLQVMAVLIMIDRREDLKLQYQTTPLRFIGRMFVLTVPTLTLISLAVNPL